jgi:predicted DNA-binding transcriptional regulator YafY
MSKRDYIIRYLLIIKKLRFTKSATFIEINEFVKREFELLDAPKEISLRTFQRDLNEIRSIFNIDIKCNNSNQYYIEEDERSGFNNRLLEAFDIINSLNIGGQLTPHVLLENRSPLGTEHIFDLLNALRTRQLVILQYQKFHEEDPTSRQVEPYALKEYKGRWYLLSKDKNDGIIKTFGLDRIKRVEILKRKYVFPNDFNPNNYFKYCFGIINSEDADPVDVILSFEPLQGKYIKSYPLHESQKVIIDNDTELRISLSVYETYDLIMELLSYGSDLRVIQPKSLVNIISKTIKEMSKQYQINY